MAVSACGEPVYGSLGFGRNTTIRVQGSGESNSFNDLAGFYYVAFIAKFILHH